MSFMISTYGLPRIHDYRQALARWERTRPWHGRLDGDARPLDGNRAFKHKSIRKTSDGDIALCLHHTDVVTYHPGGGVTVRTWASVSTNAFANCLLPPGLRADFNTSAGSILWVDRTGGEHGYEGRGYLVPDKAMLRKDDSGQWRVEGAVPFTKYILNKKKAARARARYAAVWRQARKWIAARKALDRDWVEGRWGPRMTISETRGRGLIECLEGPRSGWEALLFVDANDVMLAMYACEGCIEETRVPFVTSCREVRAICHGANRYKYL